MQSVRLASYSLCICNRLASIVEVYWNYYQFPTWHLILLLTPLTCLLFCGKLYQNWRRKKRDRDITQNFILGFTDIMRRRWFSWTSRRSSVYHSRCWNTFESFSVGFDDKVCRSSNGCIQRSIFNSGCFRAWDIADYQAREPTCTYALCYQPRGKGSSVTSGSSRNERIVFGAKRFVRPGMRGFCFFSEAFWEQQLLIFLNVFFFIIHTEYPSVHIYNQPYEILDNRSNHPSLHISITWLLVIIELFEKIAGWLKIEALVSSQSMRKINILLLCCKSFQKKSSQSFSLISYKW